MKRTRHQRRAARKKALYNALVNLTDAVWMSGLKTDPNIEGALVEAQKQLDITDGIIRNPDV